MVEWVAVGVAVASVVVSGPSQCVKFAAEAAGSPFKAVAAKAPVVGAVPAPFPVAVAA